ncbi:TetR/AcrR family transcriptional regulator [Plantactinospora sonchi]|uniref:Helix-turn-helix domain-containing protein n=1 Tax=Plantactinospora sonchi TaxID=1544735 RepID=A0ABU7RNQ6_9ACTN
MSPGKVRTRERIKAAALELFDEQSYGTTTLQDIADRLGLTKAALYYYFKTKDELLEEISAPFLDGFQRIVTDAEARPHAPDELRTLLLALTTHLLGQRRMVTVLAFDRSVTKHAVKQRMHELTDRTVALLVGPQAQPAQVVRARATIGAIMIPVLSLPAETDGADVAATISAVAGDTLKLE